MAGAFGQRLRIPGIKCVTKKAGIHPQTEPTLKERGSKLRSHWTTVKAPDHRGRQLTRILSIRHHLWMQGARIRAVNSIGLGIPTTHILQEMRPSAIDTGARNCLFVFPLMREVMGGLNNEPSLRYGQFANNRPSGRTAASITGIKDGKHGLHIQKINLASATKPA